MNKDSDLLTDEKIQKLFMSLFEYQTTEQWMKRSAKAQHNHDSRPDSAIRRDERKRIGEFITSYQTSKKEDDCLYFLPYDFTDNLKQGATNE